MGIGGTEDVRLGEWWRMRVRWREGSTVGRKWEEWQKTLELESKDEVGRWTDKIKSKITNILIISLVPKMHLPFRGGCKDCEMC